MRNTIVLKFATTTSIILMPLFLTSAYYFSKINNGQRNYYADLSIILSCVDILPFVASLWLILTRNEDLVSSIMKVYNKRPMTYFIVLNSTIVFMMVIVKKFL